MSPRAPELPPYERPTIARNASSQSKVSVPSISQSNEADDEQSLSSDQSLDMESHDSQPHYEGEDTRLTSDKELRGFYMYGWAAEVLHPFLPSYYHPVLLQAFASLLQYRKAVRVSLS